MPTGVTNGRHDLFLWFLPRAGAMVMQAAPVHDPGRVHYRRTQWPTRTDMGKTNKPGDGVTIRRVCVLY
ncbi:MAG TPA: hypothetical protein VGB67_02560 [Fibrella sp.]